MLMSKKKNLGHVVCNKCNDKIRNLNLIHFQMFLFFPHFYHREILFTFQ